LKFIASILVLFCGGLLIYGTVDFPAWADPLSPASLHVSNYYIENTMKDTSVPNIVTAVLADYRGYDTMFETAVIFSAGIACFFLLRNYRRRAPQSRMYRHIETGMTLRIEEGGKIPASSSEFERIDLNWVPQDLIIRLTCRLIVPFIMLFALYVIAHGHHSPGGGFQGGVIFGAAVILFAISFDLRRAIEQMTEKMIAIVSALGVLIYAGTGAICLLMGSNFLDYSALAPILGVDAVMARSHGILIVEIGVGIAVMAVMIGLYFNLSSRDIQDEGL
jgi:multicomponent Na+:H+ antiporter subunit B